MTYVRSLYESHLAPAAAGINLSLNMDLFPADQQPSHCQATFELSRHYRSNIFLA